MGPRACVGAGLYCLRDALPRSSALVSMSAPPACPDSPHLHHHHHPPLPVLASAPVPPAAHHVCTAAAAARWYRSYRRQKAGEMAEARALYVRRLQQEGAARWLRVGLDARQARMQRLAAAQVTHGPHARVAVRPLLLLPFCVTQALQSSVLLLSTAPCLRPAYVMPSVMSHLQRGIPSAACQSSAAATAGGVASRGRRRPLGSSAADHRAAEAPRCVTLCMFTCLLDVGGLGRALNAPPPRLRHVPPCPPPSPITLPHRPRPLPKNWRWWSHTPAGGGR